MCVDMSHSLQCGKFMSGKVTTSLTHGIQGFTAIGGPGIQSGFLHHYSPGSFSSPTPERAM